MKIGLIDFDGKIPNIALMKLSAFHKEVGNEVILNPSSKIDKAYCSVLFEKNKLAAAALQNVYEDIEFGGTGWDLITTLPDHIEKMNPDYTLYTAADIAPRLKGILTKEKRREKAETLIKAGIGFTTRGCVRNCPFCVVPKKEGKIRKASEIADIINPRSNVIVLLDANFTADPDCLEKLREIKERNLIVDFSQGIDVRTMTLEIAKALSEVRHLRSLHYAWDLMPSESAVFKGIGILSPFIKRWKHLCFVLTGFNTSFDEDMYRFKRLMAQGVDPYIMVYNNSKDLRLRHFARWINSRIYNVCKDFKQYTPWVKCREEYFTLKKQSLLAA